MELADSFDLAPADAQLLLSSHTHLGSRVAESSLRLYIYRTRPDGVNIINIGKTWEKIVFAARIIAAISSIDEVVAVSSRTYGQRAVSKFCRHTGASPIIGRFIPGTFTNHITRTFKEPRLIIITDPRSDSQAVREASNVNIPVIALTDLDSPVRFVDVAIPCNNRGKHSIGVVWYLLTREVLRLRGVLHNREQDWEVLPDSFFYVGDGDIQSRRKLRI